MLTIDNQPLAMYLINASSSGLQNSSTTTRNFSPVGCYFLHVAMETFFEHPDVLRNITGGKESSMKMVQTLERRLEFNAFPTSVVEYFEMDLEK